MLLRKVFTIGVVSLAGFASLNGAWGDSNAPLHLTGYITDTWCGVNRDTKPPTAECTKTCVTAQGAKYAFYDKASDKVYIVKDQAAVASLAGASVVIDGIPQHSMAHVKTMRGDREVDTISIASIREVK